MTFRSRPLGLTAVALLSLSTALFGTPAPVGAQQQPPPKSRQELAGAIDEVSAQEAAAVQQLQGVQSQRQQLDVQVAALDGQVAQANLRLLAAEAEVGRITTQVEAVQRQVDQIKAEIKRSKDKFDQAAVAMYKDSGGSDESFTLLASTRDTHNVVAGTKYLATRSEDYQQEIVRQGQLRDQLGDAQKDLEVQQAAAQQAERAASTERDRVTQLRGQADAQRQQAAAAEQQEQQLVEGLRAQKADFQAQYDAMQAQIAAAVSRGNPTPPASGNHRFIWPVDGPIDSPFGYRVDPVLGGSRLHAGVDIGAGMGTPIKAAGDGVVTMAGWNGGYGNFTLIDHGDGLATGYGHQSEIDVSVGQHVSTGEVIGKVGSTGASTGPHLHWEVRVNGSPVDPMGWV